MAYLGKTPSQAVRSRYYFTATGGETSLSGADDNSNTLTFTDGNYVDVALNGVTLVAGTDYNTTTANTIGGLTALVASDVVEVIVYDTFSVFGGNMAANLNFKDNVKANFGTGNDLQIFHDAANSIINDAGTGNLQLQLGGSNKLEVTSTGVDVTGAISSNKGSAGTLATFTDGVNSNFVVETASLLTTIGNGGGSAALAFKANNTEAMRIDSSGNVGVGTSNPNSGKLHVSHTTGTIGYFESTQAAANVSNVVLNSTQTNSSANATFQINHGTTAQGQIRLNGDSSFAVHNKAGLAESLRITTAGNVGIGTASPASALHISSNSYPQLEIDDKASRNYAMGVTSSTFRIRDVTGAADRLTIDSGGNVGIGCTPSTVLDVEGSNINFAAGENGILNVFSNDAAATDKGGSISLGGNSESGALGFALIKGAKEGTDSGYLAFGTRTAAAYSTERWRINAAGHFVPAQLNNGIILGSTASVASNLLNDYEVGTWTGTLKGLASDPTTPVTATGTYTKIGRMVHAEIKFSNVSNVGASGNVFVNGIPFAPNVSYASSGNCASYRFDFPTGLTSLSAQVTTTALYPYVSGDSADWDGLKHAPGTARYLEISASYITT